MKTEIVLAITVVMLAGCGKLDCSPGPGPACQAPQAPQQAPQPAPVVVQQAPAPSGMKDMLVGGAIGALATHALTSRSTPAAPAPVTNTRVIERTVVVRQAPRPTLVAPATRPRLSYTPPNRVVPSRKVSLTKRK